MQQEPVGAAVFTLAVGERVGDMIGERVGYWVKTMVGGGSFVGKGVGEATGADVGRLVGWVGGGVGRSDPPPVLKQNRTKHAALRCEDEREEYKSKSKFEKQRTGNGDSVRARI